MSHSILRVTRVKGSSNTKGIQRHNQRENENYNNKDINHSETDRNYDLINGRNIEYQQVIDETINANYVGKRAIRKDAIKHVDGLITSDKEFFEDMEDFEIKSFFKESLEFLENEYGKENMLYATVHLDESVPHMHFGFVPLTEDGRLSAKEKLGNKKALTELQDRFNAHMNDRGHDMERGTSKQVTERQHRQMDQYKEDTAFHQQELAEVKRELQKAKTDLQDEIERIRSVGAFDYEDERKGLFGGKEETGRKILSADEFERLRKTVSSAERIVDDYEKLKNQDLYKENKKLLKDNEFQNRRAQEWTDKALEYDGKADRLEKENRDLREELSVSQEFQNSAVRLYRVARGRFPGFERGFNVLKEKCLNEPKFERVGQFMDVVQDNVHKVDRKREKRRTDDLEL